MGGTSRPCGRSGPDRWALRRAVGKAQRALAHSGRGLRRTDVYGDGMRLAGGTLMVPTADDSSDERGTRRGTILEVLLAFAIIVGFAAGYVPISEVPLLVLLGWLSLRRRKLDWSAVGLTRPAKPRRVALLTLTGIAYAVIALYIVDPFIDRISGPADLSDFADVRGNVGLLVFWIALSWILGAFGEELAYRGYLMSRIGGLLGQTANAWRLSLILTSVLFGIAHISEGTSGVIS